MHLGDAMLTKNEIESIKASVRERRYPSFAALERLADMALAFETQPKQQRQPSAPSFHASDAGPTYADQLKEKLGLGQVRKNYAGKGAHPMTAREMLDLHPMTGGPLGLLKRAVSLHLANGCIEIGEKEALSLGLPPSVYANQDWPELDIPYRVYERRDNSVLIVFASGSDLKWPDMPAGWADLQPVIERSRS